MELSELGSTEFLLVDPLASGASNFKMYIKNIPEAFPLSGVPKVGTPFFWVEC